MHELDDSQLCGRSKHPRARARHGAPRRDYCAAPLSKTSPRELCDGHGPHHRSDGRRVLGCRLGAPLGGPAGGVRAVRDCECPHVISRPRPVWHPMMAPGNDGRRAQNKGTTRSKAPAKAGVYWFARSANSRLASPPRASRRRGSLRDSIRALLAASEPERGEQSASRLRRPSESSAHGHRHVRRQRRLAPERARARAARRSHPIVRRSFAIETKITT